MSTKSTIAYGRNFHLYHEALDEDYVYLELEGTKFEASYNRVMVPIPVHVWEVIRRYPGIDLKYADKRTRKSAGMWSRRLTSGSNDTKRLAKSQKDWSHYPVL
jgi:hypothetical protein